MIKVAAIKLKSSKFFYSKVQYNRIITVKYKDSFNYFENVNV